MNLKRGIAVIALLGMCSGICLAEEAAFSGLLKSADSEYRKGNYGAALDIIDRAKVIAFEKAPLTLNNFQLVKVPGEAFGVYESREGNVYRPGEKVYIYCEPVGYTFKKKGGLYELSMSTDFTVSDSEGNILGGQKNFGTFGFTSGKPNTEFMLNLTYTFTGITPGKYLIETTVRDNFSDKKTTESIEFEVKEGPTGAG